MRTTDCIIVGQGIAGTLLAFELISRGRSVVIIDDPQRSQSSRAAGGIYNPIVFKRLTKSWMAGEVLPVMMDVFTRLEETLQKKLLFPIRINRVLSEPAEQDLWKKRGINELAEFLDPAVHEPGGELEFLHTKYGTVTQAGYVDMEALMSGSRKYFEEKNCLVSENFDYDELLVEENSCTYKNIHSQKVIFCEGHLVTKNPWFDYVKFKPAKGELLLVHCPQLKLHSVLTKDFFILPVDKPGYFKVGATYDWDNLTDITTQKARIELTEKLSKLIPYPFEVVDQKAGVRPATIDRRPVIGFHPVKKNLGIFNGFGTKAVMLAPYFAKHFCSFMENKTGLWQEVDVNRFAAGSSVK
jgi:glycine/D-amino acid oxidase-like deaminating enzyme